MQDRKIALLGHGVVGSGVMEVLTKNHDSIAKKAGFPIEVKYILDLRDFPELPYHDRFVKDFNVILNDPEISVVVEVLGGLHPAYDFTKAALLAGKSVVTSNKEVVATCGAELVNLARQQGQSYLFEASVGGGIPIIRPLHQCLAANQLDEICGILNGTTNYILTRMMKAGLGFDDALAEAQQKSYAERDPSADIEGVDACRKICILAALAFGRHIYPQHVHTEGITKLTLADTNYAEEHGYAVKLLGRAVRQGDGAVYAVVAPFLVSHDNPLSNVEDVFNGILVKGDAIGDVMFYGRGAGKLPTASAVVADVIDIVKNEAHHKQMLWEDSGENLVSDYTAMTYRFYLRVQGADRREELERTFGGECDTVGGDLALITRPMREADFRSAAAAFSPLGVIRVLDD
ncbi:homoserine dehydrogenase [Feifania hominis]|uniref:Homoserine dehydrogenase n=1 Tax=Feifania hominis TaxID=2763660 RepID=A0A926DGR6_9FIRM|nr:homoserine dehydrogenase [Feifania hominis]MBC8536999.1 homoserine dehydrogenase [Feifania hominis]